MNNGSLSRKYAFPLVRPALPEPDEWIPFLRASYDQHWFSNFGPVASRLEEALAEKFGMPGQSFVLTSSATAALAACLISQRIKGRVLMPAFTFPATFASIRMAGAEPMLVDVNTKTWSCDLDKLSQALKLIKPQAVILVAPFGITQDFAEHVSLCEAAGAIVIVDNAAGLGGGNRRKQEPSRERHFEVFSLHATKPFAVGEGGAIVADTKYVPALRAALNFGLPWTSDAGKGWGINGKLPDVSAAIGLAVLSGFPDVVGVRQQQAARYIRLFDHFRSIAIHRVVADSSWQVFPCLFPDPAATVAFVDEAARRGLEVRRYYRPSLADWGGLEIAGDCTGAGYLAERMVSLPIYSRTTEEEIDELHELVKQCLQRALA